MYEWTHGCLSFFELCSSVRLTARGRCGFSERLSSESTSTSDELFAGNVEPFFCIFRAFERYIDSFDFCAVLCQVEDEDAFDEETDTLKFRLVLRPETEENNQASSAQGPTSAAVAGPGEGGALPLHRLMIQTVGGRSCSQVYCCCDHVGTGLRIY